MIKMDGKGEGRRITGILLTLAMLFFLLYGINPFAEDMHYFGFRAWAYTVTCTLSGISEATSYSYVTGTSVYYNNASTGDFIVSISASTTGGTNASIKNVTYPTTVSAGGNDSLTPYNWTYTWDSADKTNYAPATATCYNNWSDSNTASFNVYWDNAAPTLNFALPTSANNSYVSRNYTEVNMTITEAGAGLDTFKFNWNNTNYSFYDDSLVLAMNFNNNSAIGDSATNIVDISKYGNDGTTNKTIIDEFNSTESWTENQITGSASEGNYVAQITNITDPYFLKDITDFDESYNTLTIRYKSYVNGPTQIQLFYTDNTDCSGFSETCSQYFTGIISDGEWHTLDVQVTDAEWIDNDGTIDDLRVDFNFQSTTGTVYIDYIHFSNGPIWTAGKFGSALSFDSINDYIEILNNPTLNFGAGDFSIGFWTYQISAGYQGGSYIARGAYDAEGFNSYDAIFRVNTNTGELAQIGLA
ncbi:MAG: hypothetical protein NTV63_04475, partial [Candidatus Woesearchaeota archaeon]|nr:hypothetical protein [Candidatus Woesearchaeota archaeon]